MRLMGETDSRDRHPRLRARLPRPLWLECASSFRHDETRSDAELARADADRWRDRAEAAADRLAERVATDIARRPTHDERGRFTRKT